MCFLAVIYGTHRAHGPVVDAVNGRVVLLSGARHGRVRDVRYAAAALWLVIPAPPGGSNRWAWSGLAAAVVAAALMLAGQRQREPRESFLEFYRTARSRSRCASVTLASCRTRSRTSSATSQG